MKLLNLFGGKLPKGSVVWCIGLPYTKEAFLCSCNKAIRSDFIDSLELQYNTTDEEILWTYYEHTARKISKAVQNLQKKNVTIVNLSSVEQLRTIFSYSTIIITAHRHRYLNCLDFMGNTVEIDKFIDAIPIDYKGILDISSCYSTTFQMKCKQKAINAIFLAAETEISIELRLFIYQHTIKYLISFPNSNYLDAFRIIISRIVRNAQKKTNQRNDVFLGGKASSKKILEGSASAFAPSEIKRGDTMMIQIYVYEDVEHHHIICEAKKADEDAVERSYIPLNFNIKKGDNVIVSMNIFNSPEYAQTKSFIWHNRSTKTCFIIPVSKIYPEDKIFVEIFLSVNNAILGELDFSISVVDTYASKREIANVLPKQFNKVFISYSHLDEQNVKFIAEAYKAIGIDHFFDRHYLKPGDVFPQEIQDYINSADLFILCWSENASKSEYVEKERMQALKRAFPQVKPQQAPKLSIYPISIEPRTELPTDMKDNYHFGEM